MVCGYMEAPHEEVAAVTVDDPKNPGRQMRLVRCKRGLGTFGGVLNDHLRVELLNSDGRCRARYIFEFDEQGTPPSRVDEAWAILTVNPRADLKDIPYDVLIDTSDLGRPKSGGIIMY